MELFNIKKVISFIISAIIMLFAITGCASTCADDGLIVFAASSLTETLTLIAEEYKNTNPDTNIVFNFDSSGTLKTQIEQGADCDIFISASVKPMDSLSVVDSDTRLDLLENKVVLASSSNAHVNFASFEDLFDQIYSKNIMIAIGNSDVPVGEYTFKIFDHFDVSEDMLVENGLITYGSSVKEVTTQISEGLVDCGIVYQTDATAENLKIIDTATTQMCGKVVYPAAVLDTSDNRVAAQDFMDFLVSEQADTIFVNAGFTPLK